MVTVCLYTCLCHDSHATEKLIRGGQGGDPHMISRCKVLSHALLRDGGMSVWQTRCDCACKEYTTDKGGLKIEFMFNLSFTRVATPHIKYVLHTIFRYFTFFFLFPHESINIGCNIVANNGMQNDTIPWWTATAAATTTTTTSYIVLCVGWACPQNGAICAHPWKPT